METQLVKDKFTYYQVFIITILTLVQFTIILDFMIMVPLGDMLMKSLELSTKQFGFSVSAYALTAGVSGFLTAGFADRYDRKRLLLLFYTGFILGTTLCGLTHSYILLLMARIIAGFFGGVVGSLSMAIVTDLFPLEKRGRALGFLQLGFGASQVLGIPIGLYIANRFGWQSPFLMIGAIAFVFLAVIAARMFPVTDHLDVQRDHSPLVHLWRTMTNIRYRTGFFSTALLSLGGFMMLPWASSFAINNLHVGVERLPLLFMISGISSLLIIPVIGRLTDKFSKFRLFTAAAFFTIVTVLIYTNLNPSPFWVVALVNSIMLMAVLSRVIPATALTSALPEIPDRGAFMSINAALQQITGGIAAGIGGLIVAQKDKFSPLEHYNIVGYFVVAITLISIYSIYKVSRLIKPISRASTLSKVKMG